MDVGGAGIEAVEQQLIDESDHGGAQRQVLEMLDVVIALAPAGRQLGRSRRLLGRPEAVDGGVDVLGGCHAQLDGAAGGQLDGIDGGGVPRIGGGQHQALPVDRER